MLKFDYSAHQCPTPVVETRKQILANPGVALEIQVGDTTASENISRLAASQGYAIEQQTVEGGFTLRLTPGETSQSNSQSPAPAPADGPTIVYCKSDRMGDGDDELGRILLKNFFITLLDLDPLPETILFVNSGVRLVCNDSEALESLNGLACRGVDIAACGLCLDFYQLKEQVAVGRVTNMLSMVEAQLQAGRILSP